MSHLFKIWPSCITLFDWTKSQRQFNQSVHQAANQYVDFRVLPGQSSSLFHIVQHSRIFLNQRCCRQNRWYYLLFLLLVNTNSAAFQQTRLRLVCLSQSGSCARAASPTRCWLPPSQEIGRSGLFCSLRIPLIQLSFDRYKLDACVCVIREE